MVRFEIDHHASDPAVISEIFASLNAMFPGARLRVLHEARLPATETAPVAIAAALDPAQVERVVAIVRPSDDQHARRAFLRAALGGGDTLTATEGGEFVDSHRASSAALSRVLRAEFPDDTSPLDRLLTRSREYFHDGSYKGIAYTPTPLGTAVFDALRREGAI